MPPRSSAVLIGLALAVPLAVCATLSAARGTVASDNAVLVLVLVVVAVAASGSRLAGVVAALSSAAWFDYFLTRPLHHFTIADRDDVETAVLLTLVGIAVTEIALWGRRQQARLSERETDQHCRRARWHVSMNAPALARIKRVARILTRS